MKGIILLLPILVLGAPLSLLGPGGAGRPGTPADELRSGSRAKFELRVRDSQTGRAVAATVMVEGDDRSAGTGSTASASRSLFRTDSAGRVTRLLPPGHRRCEVSARGYLALRSHFTLAPGGSYSTVFWLDPIDKPEELKAESVAAQLQDGYTLLHGHVTDAVTGMPVAAVRVRDVLWGEAALTDSNGYFSLMVPARQTWTDETVPATGELGAERDGYKSHAIRGVKLADGADTHFIVDMEPGTGLTVWEDAQSRTVLDSQPTEGEVFEAEPEPLPRELIEWLYGSDSETSSGTPNRGPGSNSRRTAGAGITVGLNCPVKPCGTKTCPDCTVACATWETMTMEEYVQRGLDAEWKVQWDLDSVRAGAVAYRSVGAYFVAHPINANYDIRSDACNQAYDADTTTKTTRAATDTAGGVLKTATDTVLKAEYARENNMRYCADGQTGSPSAGWPCMSDMACAGAARDLRSHGRGMCQRGSQRWAAGTDVNGQVVRDPWCWRCILDHYYNDNGNSTGAGTDNRQAFLSDNVGHPIVYTSDDTNGWYISIYKIQPDGSAHQRLTPGGTNNYAPRISPDGERIVFCSDRSGNPDIYLMSIRGTGVTRITDHPEDDFDPAWSPDGSRIVFASYRDSKCEIYVMKDDGTGQIPLTDLPGCQVDPAWSPDGRQIAFTSRQTGGVHDIYVMNADGTGLRQLTTSLSIDVEPAWSPDGQKIAFVSFRDDETHSHIYVMNADGSNQRPLTGGLASDRTPSWAPDGRRIVFERTNDVYLMNSDGTGQTLLIDRPGFNQWTDWGRCPYIGP